MKLFGHPVHIMLIHFPAALFPMELVCYFIFYKTGDASFANASFYAITGGAVIGWLAIVTGAIDLIMIKDNGNAQAKALIHGTLNSIVVVGYSIIGYVMYKQYPALPPATTNMLMIKAGLNIFMIAGNYFGGNLILKHRIGVIS